MSNTQREPYCNHDTAAIRDGICECGARPRVFATAEDLARCLVSEFGETPEYAAHMSQMEEGQIDTGDLGTPPDIWVIGRIDGWYLLLPYRSPEAQARRS